KSERAPSQCCAISRCPVLDTGRNSVSPSRMPSRRADSGSDMGSARPGVGRITKTPSGTGPGDSSGAPACAIRLRGSGTRARWRHLERMLPTMVQSSQILHHLRAVRRAHALLSHAKQSLALMTGLARGLLQHGQPFANPEAVTDVALERRKADQGPQVR